MRVGGALTNVPMLMVGGQLIEEVQQFINVVTLVVTEGGTEAEYGATPFNIKTTPFNTTSSNISSSLC